MPKKEETKSPAEWVSIREYARQKGVGETTIRHHIKQGRLEGCIDYSKPKRPLINIALADKSLAESINPNYDRGRDLGELNRSVSAPISQLTITDVKKKTAEIKMHREALLLRKEKGELVDKAEVYKALFAAGAELRNAFTTIPDRIIDQVLASQDRAEAHQVLTNAIQEALNKISEIEGREIAKP